MKKGKAITRKGFREILNCGENVERVTIEITHKHRAFKARKKDRHIYTKGKYPLRIIVEDSPMWGASR